LFITFKKNRQFGGYFFDATNNANIHPTNDHPNIIDPIRVRITSYFERPFAAARYAGVKTMHMKIVMTMTYFNIDKMLLNIAI